MRHARLFDFQRALRMILHATLYHAQTIIPTQVSIEGLAPLTHGNCTIPLDEKTQPARREPEQSGSDPCMIQSRRSGQADECQKYRCTRRLRPNPERSSCRPLPCSSTVAATLISTKYHSGSVALIASGQSWARRSTEGSPNKAGPG
jgi:hypothetical protein